MRLVVTGAEGQLARSLAALSGPDVEIVTLGRPALDLSRPETIRTAFDGVGTFDAIVSAAAYTAVDRAEAEPDLALRVNRDGAGAVARVAAGAGVPILHLSTDYVFSGDKAELYVETDPTDPINVYGASKLAGETAVLSESPRAIVLRTSWVYAPFGANFVRTMLRLASRGAPIRVVADQIGCPNYAPDLAVAIVSIARQTVTSSDPAHAGVFNLSCKEAITWHGFAEKIMAASSRAGGPSVAVEPILSADYPQAARRPANSQLDSGKVGRVFGIELRGATAALDDCVPALLAGVERAS